MLWLFQERAEGLLIRIWVFPPELAILRTATIPTVLVERGIIVNRDEELLISNAQYQDKVVNALVNGIINLSG
jgi:N-acetylmuramoyl-L-alanine amidase